jgi:hypothetical protein
MRPKADSRASLTREFHFVVSKTNMSYRMKWNFDETLTLNEKFHYIVL